MCWTVRRHTRCATDVAVFLSLVLIDTVLNGLPRILELSSFAL